MLAQKWKMLVGGVALIVLAGGCAVMGVPATLEQPAYKVLERLPGDVEIREYAARTYVASVVEGEGMEVRRQGFRLLFNYIAGGNARDEEISMTVPVATEIQDGMHEMHFYLPSKYTEETAPKPANENVHLGTFPPRIEAVLRYTGSQSNELAEKRMVQLKKVLVNSDWQAIGEPRSLFYNPPFSVSFLRRNEAIVEVTSK